MATEPRRDPRTDPRPGDVLEVKPGCCLFRHVSAAHGNHVAFHSRCGQQWFNATFRDSLKDWRAVMADARVVQVGSAV